jgi:hypothetical protein
MTSHNRHIGFQDGRHDARPKTFFCHNFGSITDTNIIQLAIPRFLGLVNQIVPSGMTSHDHHIGFQFIGENTRLLYDLLEETEKRKILGLLLLVMSHYNSGPNNIKQWITTLCKDISSRIINNGHMSEKFKLSRGVRQGDPLSPLLFILAVEPLATAVKNSKGIKGIEIDELLLIISQYVDDTIQTFILFIEFFIVGTAHQRCIMVAHFIESLS